MTFRDFISNTLDRKLQITNKPISKELQIAGVLKKLEPAPILFNNIIESHHKVAGNLLCTKQNISDYLQIETDQLIPELVNAISNPSKCKVIQTAPCQEQIIENPDLDTLPILMHSEKDGGNYISSGILIADHPQYGQNLDFHRCMQFSKKQMAVRVVKSRHFDSYLQDQKSLDVAICVGNAPNVMLAAAISVDIGVNELEIANTLSPTPLVKAKTANLYVPADSEFILEGTIHFDQKHSEGPFIDLTETYDIIRQEPVFELKLITHRKNAIWHALLPGGLEHKLLMGMPREPTIYNEVNKVAKCLDVFINPGGTSWLHAIVQIDKQTPEDGKKAILAAFKGHRSCKHVFVVDKDIDIYNPLEVEWAMATRFQGDKNMLILDKEPGSSLDPSAEPGTKMTTKIGFDLTKPLGQDSQAFEKAQFPDIDLNKFIEVTK